MSKLIPIFLASVHDKDLIFTPKTQEKFHDYLATIPGQVEVTVAPFNERDHRSIQQNRYLWGVIYKLISDHTGFTDEETHEIFKTMFLWKYISIADREIKITQSTTELDTKSFSEYCEKIREFASADLGLNIPDPESVLINE